MIKDTKGKKAFSPFPRENLQIRPGDLHVCLVFYWLVGYLHSFSLSSEIWKVLDGIQQKKLELLDLVPINISIETPTHFIRTESHFWPICRCQHHLRLADSSSRKMIFTKTGLEQTRSDGPEKAVTMFVFIVINWNVVEGTRQMLQEVPRIAA